MTADEVCNDPGARPRPVLRSAAGRTSSWSAAAAICSRRARNS